MTPGSASPAHAAARRRPRSPVVAAPRAERLPVAWLVVVHPNPEVAAGRATLAREVFPGARVSWSVRGTDVVRPDRALPQGPGAVLVHVDGLDRFRSTWAGHRVLRRLAARERHGIAWIASDDREAHANAIRAGACGIVAERTGSDDLRADRAAQLRAVVLGSLGDRSPRPAAPRAPSDEADAGLSQWFVERYGVAWQPWIEHAVAVVVCGGERTEQAEALRRAILPATGDHALRRLRQVNEILCGEIRGNEVVLRREALAVLRRIGWLRPIVAEPLVIHSLQRAARLLRADPLLAAEAGLSATEVADLVEVAAAEHEAAERPVRKRGRPEAGAWRLRRHQALGRVAERRGQTAAEKLDALEALRGGLDDTLDAVYDALADRERATAH